MLLLPSVWCRAAGQSVWPGGSAAPEVQHHLHEWPGPRRDLRCHRHADSHRQWATHIHTEPKKQNCLIPSCLVTENVQNGFRASQISMTLPPTTQHTLLHFKDTAQVRSLLNRVSMYLIYLSPRIPSSLTHAFVSQVMRTLRQQRWVTSSRHAWGLWLHSSATSCCPAWSVSLA